MENLETGEIMAIVKLTDLYANLNDWPGRLFTGTDGVTVGAHIGAAFSFTYLPGTIFAGYTVTAGGTGFTYDGNTPTGGTMKSLTITDAIGHTVISITGIAANSIASDLSLFASQVFGWTDPDGNHANPDETKAWSLLLSGNDTITGTAGNDRQGLIGVDAGNDVFNMGAGDDQVNGGLGNDMINGGDGYDTLAYDRTVWNEGIPVVRGITVNVVKGTVLDPYGYTDHITSIEQIRGSFARDVFVGGATEVDFEGLRGADKFVGGSSGDDYVMYMDDTWKGGNRGIVANLGVSILGSDINGTIRDGFGNLDRTVNIHNVAGTRYADSFTGSSLNDRFSGGEGKDSYNGGGGTDIVDFSWTFTGDSQHGIVIDLSKTTNQIVDDGFGNTETAKSIEYIIGSKQNDTIKGSSGNETFRGQEGDDTLTGGGGNDTFRWNHFSEIGANDAVTDFHAAAGSDQDKLQLNVTEWGGTTTLHLVNGSAASAAVDTFIFNPTSHLLSWDPDGTGSQAAISIAVLSGVASLTAANFDLF